MVHIPTRKPRHFYLTNYSVNSLYFNIYLTVVGKFKLLSCTITSTLMYTIPCLEEIGNTYKFEIIYPYAWTEYITL